jgi:hypothetical protein
MKQSDINSTAREIFNLVNPKPVKYDTADKFVRVFYRKIARWHLAKMSKMRPPIKESVRKKLLLDLEEAQALTRPSSGRIPKGTKCPVFQNYPGVAPLTESDESATEEDSMH